MTLAQENWIIVEQTVPFLSFSNDLYKKCPDLDKNGGFQMLVQNRFCVDVMDKQLGVSSFSCQFAST